MPWSVEGREYLMNRLIGSLADRSFRYLTAWLIDELLVDLLIDL